MWEELRSESSLGAPIPVPSFSFISSSSSEPCQECGKVTMDSVISRDLRDSVVKSSTLQMRKLKLQRGLELS